MTLHVGDYILYGILNEYGMNSSETKVVSGFVIGDYPSFYLIDLGKYKDTIHKNDLKKLHILRFDISPENN